MPICLLRCCTQKLARPMMPSAVTTSSEMLTVISRPTRSEEHTSELQSQSNLVCRLLLEKKKKHHASDTEQNGLLHRLRQTQPREILSTAHHDHRVFHSNYADPTDRHHHGGAVCCASTRI